MKYILIVTLVLFISCKENNKFNLREEIINDTLFGYDSNDTLRIKVHLINKKKNGIEFKYDSLGKLYSVSEYRNDTIQGFVNEFYRSGIMKYQGYYLNGKRFTENIEYFDGFQDSTIAKRKNKLFIVPYSTRIKEFAFYDLREKKQYFRRYNIKGRLIEKKGRIFQYLFHPIINSKINNDFTQKWISVDLSRKQALKVKQYYIITNSENNYKDTVHAERDSTLTKWTSNIKKSGTYNFHAIAYLYENGSIETDTSKFKVIISN